jgi:hypothetical protein
MIDDYILNEYFYWLYTLVNKRRYARRSYKKLLRLLHSMTFTYEDDFDSNRAADGEELRWRYVYEGGGNKYILEWEEPCTVLEMMIALCFHMNNIMENSDDEYTVAYWFWMMISNLELDGMNDSKFNTAKVKDSIFRFMNREYEPDGKGNIIRIEDCKSDLRDVEIWWQMCWFLDSIT